MKPEERKLIQSLVVVPAGPEPISGDEFLRRFGVSDGVELGQRLLDEAVAGRDPVDVELALVVGFTFGFAVRVVPALVTLAFADWHQSHEDVASALGNLRSPASVDALVHLADWVPSYLEFDDARALAIKAIWALGSIKDDRARQALESLSRSDEEVLAESAKRQLRG